MTTVANVTRQDAAPQAGVTPVSQGNLLSHNVHNVQFTLYIVDTQCILYTVTQGSHCTVDTQCTFCGVEHLTQCFT